MLDVEDDVIGCVYVYPAHDDDHDVHVRSWVRASRAELDLSVSGGCRRVGLSNDWPFERPLYAPLWG